MYPQLQKLERNKESERYPDDEYLLKPMDINTLTPLLVIGLIALLTGNGGGLRNTDPPVNYATLSPPAQLTHPAQSTYPQHPVVPSRPENTPMEPGYTYDNGYTDSGHQNTLIGDMIDQMTHETQVRPATLAIAEDLLARCALLAKPKPTVCH